jgi:hypothetical protein
MYRQSNGKDVWHSNAGCTAWPLLNFDERQAPEGGKFCEECVEIERMLPQHRAGALAKPWDSETARQWESGQMGQ